MLSQSFVFGSEKLEHKFLFMIFVIVSKPLCKSIKESQLHLLLSVSDLTYLQIFCLDFKHFSYQIVLFFFDFSYYFIFIVCVEIKVFRTVIFPAKVDEVFTMRCYPSLILVRFGDKELVDRRHIFTKDIIEEITFNIHYCITYPSLFRLFYSKRSLCALYDNQNK